MRAVLDVNVAIAGLLSPSGSPAHILRAWREGAFELIASPLLLAELERALAYPKLTRLVPPEQARAFVHWIAVEAVLADDPPEAPPVRSQDAGDDYLIVLAAAQRALLVSGDKHLLALSDRLPVLSPAAFLEQLEERGLR